MLYEANLQTVNKDQLRRREWAKADTQGTQRKDKIGAQRVFEMEKKKKRINRSTDKG